MCLIQAMLKSSEKRGFTVKCFHDVKDRRFNNYMDFACWCNGEGHMAISTIYHTMVFFFYIGKIRYHFPFATISSHNGKKLLNVLDSIRRCFGGEYGIWTTIQDAMYNFAASDDHATPIGYRTFCERFFKEEERAWVLRILDFYYFIDKKLDHEIESMIKSLEELVGFLEELTVNSGSD